MNLPDKVTNPVVIPFDELKGVMLCAAFDYICALYEAVNPGFVPPESLEAAERIYRELSPRVQFKPQIDTQATHFIIP